MESVEKGVMGGGGGSGFSRKMMSEHRAQKFRSDDVSLPIPRSG